jgi:signal peptidase II
MRAAVKISTPKMGFLLVVLVFALDQLSKLWLLFVYDLPLKEPVSVLPFFDLVVVWNRGVSYGLFQQQTEMGRWLLVGFSLLAAAALGLWMRRVTQPLLLVSLALIIGGALGNALDRALYGAVFDFAHFYIKSWSWYVFNVADAAIVFGVLGMLLDSLRDNSRKITEEKAQLDEPQKST